LGKRFDSLITVIRGVVRFREEISRLCARKETRIWNMFLSLFLKILYEHIAYMVSLLGTTTMCIMS